MDLAFGAMLFGYDGSFWGTTYARASFQTDFGIKTMSKSQQTNTSSNLTSVYLAGAFFGSLGSWPVMEYYGRRMILRLASGIFMIGALIMTVTKGQISMMCKCQPRREMTRRSADWSVRCRSGHHWLCLWRLDISYTYVCGRV